MVLLGVEIRDYIQALKFITYTIMILNLPVYLVAVFELLKKISHKTKIKRFKQPIVNYINKPQYSVGPPLTLVICLKWLFMYIL